MRAIVLGAFVCGCSFTPGRLPGTSDDAAVDATRADGDPTTGDVPSQMVCLGSGTYEVCAQAATPVTLVGAIDTASSTLCASSQLWTGAGQPMACFIVGTSITVANATTASFSGSRPVVLFANGSITIDGTLDVSSHRSPAVVGPGSPSSACDPFGRAPGDSSSGAAGGAGGTFMSQGGDGGDGNSNSTEGQASATETASPAVLRSGCDGQAGGEGDGNAGAVGRGGGAIYVVAAGAISVNGAINASGSGAVATATTKSGGSGGGSGGMIKLHATSISGAGVVMANGGGGASGAGETDDGMPGSDPGTGTATMSAEGGGRVENSGAGGEGFAGTTQGGNGGAGTGNNTGGGGGGGGGGFIETNQALGSITASAGVVDEP